MDILEEYTALRCLMVDVLVSARMDLCGFGTWKWTGMCKYEEERQRCVFQDGLFSMKGEYFASRAVILRLVALMSRILTV